MMLSSHECKLLMQVSDVDAGAQLGNTSITTFVLERELAASQHIFYERNMPQILFRVGIMTVMQTGHAAFSCCLLTNVTFVLQPSTAVAGIRLNTRTDSTHHKQLGHEDTAQTDHAADCTA